MGPITTKILGSVMGGKIGETVTKLQKGKTDRLSATRGWAAPILSLAAGMPFCIVLWIIIKAILESSDPFVSAMKFIETIGSGYFFAIITTLIGGTTAAVGFMAKKKFDLKLEQEKTIQVAVSKNELLDPFDQAYENTMGHEGLYVDDPDDRGGETYKGISRKFHPGWVGWKIIDRCKRKRRKFPENLKTATGLDDAVRGFYKQEYWVKAKCHVIAPISRKIAIELFDSSINCGISRAVMFLQAALNNCSYGLTKESLLVDGKIGEQTIQNIDILCPKYEKALYKAMNGEQYEHYEGICKKKPSQWKFFRGWMQRV